MPGTTAIADFPICYETVPQEFVHKLDPAEVLLTGWRETGQDTYEVTARWPRVHGFYQSDNGRHDPLIFAETVRQLLPLLSHAAYDVPLGHQLIWEDFHFSVEPDALDATVDVPVRLKVHCSSVARRGGIMSTMLLYAEAYRGARRIGEARTRFTAHKPAVYRRLRGAYADARRSMDAAVAPSLPLSPERVGRISPYDVVLSECAAAGEWQLCVDTGHPVLFDHPVDHVPGMLLLEAARQATQAMAQPQQVVPVAMRTEFHRYVELDAPCRVQACTFPTQAPDRCGVRVTMHQGGALCFTVDVSVQRAPHSFPLPALVSRGAPALV